VTCRNSVLNSPWMMRISNRWDVVKGNNSCIWWRGSSRRNIRRALGSRACSLNLVSHELSLFYYLWILNGSIVLLFFKHVFQHEKKKVEDKNGSRKRKQTPGVLPRVTRGFTEFTIMASHVIRCTCPVTPCCIKSFLITWLRR
jgi:hypothetical protein